MRPTPGAVSSPSASPAASVGSAQSLRPAPSISGKRLVLGGAVLIGLFSVSLALLGTFYPAEHLAKPAEKQQLPVYRPETLAFVAAPAEAERGFANVVLPHPEGDLLLFGNHPPAQDQWLSGVPRQLDGLDKVLRDGDAEATTAGVSWQQGARLQLALARGDHIDRYDLRPQGRSYAVAAHEVLRLPSGHASALTAADWNGDGEVDLAAGTTGPATSSALYLFVARDGAYGEASHLADSRGVRHLMAIDVDADGDMDLASAERLAAPRLFVNDGRGDFALRELSAERGDFRGIAAAYLGAARPTLLFTNEGSSYPPWLRNRAGEAPLYQGQALLEAKGDGSYRDRSPDAGIFALAAAWGPLLSDLNRDGKPELLLAQNDPGYLVHRFRPVRAKMLLGFLDAPRFHFRPTRPALEGPAGAMHSVSLADWDADGDLELFWLGVGQASQVFVRKDGPTLLLRFAAEARRLQLTAAWQDATGAPLNTPLLWVAQQGRGSSQAPALALGSPRGQWLALGSSGKQQCFRAEALPSTGVLRLEATGTLRLSSTQALSAQPCP